MTVFIALIAVALVPVPHDSPLVRLKKDPVARLMGKPFPDPTFRKFAQKHDLKAAKVTYNWGIGTGGEDGPADYVVEWLQSGFEVYIEDGRIGTMSFSNTWKPDDTVAWSGPLPLGLDFSNSQLDVQKILGKGDVTRNQKPVAGHPGLTETSVHYPSYSMQIVFHTTNDTGVEMVQSLIFFKPTDWDND